MSTPPVLTGSVIVFVLACCVEDLRTRRVPNILTGSVLLLGVSLNTYLAGASGLLASISGSLTLTAILLPAFALGGIGGGDVKMMAAVGALLGPLLGLASLCAGVIIGGTIMIAHLLRRRRLGDTLARMRNMLVAALGTGSIDPLRVSPDATDAVALPYSVPLALGTLLVLLARAW